MLASQVIFKGQMELLTS